MKFAMNGALTIGTLDGANVEIREAVGPENFFLFGLTADEVARVRAEGYSPWPHYHDDPRLRDAIDLVATGHFARGDTSVFRPLVEALTGRDEYMVCADFRAYLEPQAAVAAAWRDVGHWTRMSILNVARIGRFSSDCAIADYARDIWHVARMQVD